MKISKKRTALSDEEMSQLKIKPQWWIDKMENENNTRRNTQFQGFAKALWDELMNANGGGYIDVNDTYDDGIDPTDYRGIIARRVYDLVRHAVRHGCSDHVDYAMKLIPDMAELPKEKE